MTYCAIDRNDNNNHAADRANQDIYTPRPRRRRTAAERRRQNLEAKAAMCLLIAFGLIIGIAGTKFVGWVTDRNKTRDYGRELRYSSYTVQSGDTMWDIAQEMAVVNPEFTDVRQYLSLLQDANKIYGDYLQEGTVISVPYYATPSEKMRGGGSLEETIVSTYAKYDIVQYDAWFQILGVN